MFNSSPFSSSSPIRRPLTPPLTRNWQSLIRFKPTQKFFPQDQSPLFKLPAELRLRIWRILVSGRTLHLKLRDKSLTKYSHGVCTRDCLSTPECLWDFYWPCHTSSRPEQGGFLGPLLICRRAYTELLPILYTSNTFLSHSYLGWTQHPSRQTPLWHSGRFSHLRSLRLAFDFSSPPPLTSAEKREFRDDWGSWHSHWRVLNSIPDLSELVVSVEVNAKHELFSAREDLILEPAMALRHVRRLFVVAVYWPPGQGRVAAEGAEVPFRVVRVRGTIIIGDRSNTGRLFQWIAQRSPQR